MSPRLIAYALAHLPPGCWPDAEHEGSWTVESYMLANVVDAVRELTYVVAKVNGAKHVKKPEPVYRPGGGARRRGAAGGKVRWADFGQALARAVGGAHG